MSVWLHIAWILLLVRKSIRRWLRECKSSFLLILSRIWVWWVRTLSVSCIRMSVHCLSALFKCLRFNIIRVLSSLICGADILLYQLSYFRERKFPFAPLNALNNTSYVLIKVISLFHIHIRYRTRLRPNFITWLSICWARNLSRIVRRLSSNSD